MTSDRTTGRRGWLVAAMVVLAAAVTMEELLRSGTLAEGLLDHWWGHVGSTALLIGGVGAASYFLHRAYRN
ncbi:hypothetical protein [Micromonospora sp. WMMD987]|uniref:hypothetical protein n=1 Tax=Micromonospora TaxID=1873 RepID=UPI00249CD1BA|nr:hypothetical protein [Micromonospora sp. WMMD987]WFE95317.1 hypothetical protein O7612_29195 [Micromonospora sp. WMMD987]